MAEPDLLVISDVVTRLDSSALTGYFRPTDMKSILHMTQSGFYWNNEPEKLIPYSDVFKVVLWEDSASGNYFFRVAYFKDAKHSFFGRRRFIHLLNKEQLLRLRPVLESIAPLHDKLEIKDSAKVV